MVNDHWVSALLNVGLNIVEFGDDISEVNAFFFIFLAAFCLFFLSQNFVYWEEFQVANKRVLFLSNHLGLADHFIIMTALHNKGTVVEKVLSSFLSSNSRK